MGLLARAQTWGGYAAAILRRWPPAVVAWLAAGSLTAIFGICALILYASRLDVQSAAWTASSNLAAAISQDVSREFELLDMSVLDLRDGASQPQIMNLPVPLRHAALFDRAGSAHGLGALLLLDAQGRVAEQAGVVDPTPIDLSSEPFFQVHRDRSDIGLFVSHPFVSLVDGESGIAISRRVERQGVFFGVAVGTVKLSYFQNLFSALDLGPRGSMSLILTDGTLVTRQPFTQAAAHRVLPMARITAAMGDAVSGSFEDVAAVDGVKRQYFFNRVGTLPLIQFVGRSIDDVYAAWWRRSALTALAMLLLGNTILVLVIVLQIELGRRRAAEEELAILAATDKLTGLPNRRTFDDALQAAWATSLAEGSSVALLLIDIDHFKALNDAVGHQGGDRVLARVGHRLVAFVRGTTDFAARYGGEEFVVLMPGASLDDAAGRAEALRLQVSMLGEPHPLSPTGRLTVSIGIAAAAASDGVAAASLLRAADLALYEAKRAGRNRAVVSRDTAVAA